MKTYCNDRIKGEALHLAVQLLADGERILACRRQWGDALNETGMPFFVRGKVEELEFAEEH